LHQRFSYVLPTVLLTDVSFDFVERVAGGIDEKEGIDKVDRRRGLGWGKAKLEKRWYVEKGVKVCVYYRFGGEEEETSVGFEGEEVEWGWCVVPRLCPLYFSH
jgi:hypothetical protein